MFSLTFSYATDSSLSLKLISFLATIASSYCSSIESLSYMLSYESC